mmetsp:Transcript_3345/g.7841  ORF Transcript_3345/g.7841 Transcript_3345/m.7841 type:complete len:206 (+) Transcript_3345:567-1184(+)
MLRQLLPGSLLRLLEQVQRVGLQVGHLLLQQRVFAIFPEVVEPEVEGLVEHLPVGAHQLLQVRGAGAQQALDDLIVVLRGIRLILALVLPVEHHGPQLRGLQRAQVVRPWPLDARSVVQGDGHKQHVFVRANGILQLQQLVQVPDVVDNDISVQGFTRVLLLCEVVFVVLHFCSPLQARAPDARARSRRARRHKGPGLQQKGQQG